ncbi:hypothetical protein ACQ5SO_06120 [Rhodovulum sp. DZ06]|uniref:hypothetical protein n=1 Tax=Rhodovulum sp. DZ06 TaxID=3425126 RepID=UPI003D34F42E
MDAQAVEAHAIRLYEALGPKAIAHAAQRATEADDAGKPDDAHSWRRIEERLKERRGAHES